jgi:hypothetical protein
VRKPYEFEHKAVPPILELSLFNPMGSVILVAAPAFAACVASPVRFTGKHHLKNYV